MSTDGVDISQVVGETEHELAEKLEELNRYYIILFLTMLEP